MTLSQQLQYTDDQIRNEWPDSWAMWHDLNLFSLTASTHVKLWITLGSRILIPCLFLYLCRVTRQATQKQKKDQELIMMVCEQKTRENQEKKKKKVGLWELSIGILELVQMG